MPYIKPEDRKRINIDDRKDGGWHGIAVEEINTAGELQYAIAVIIKSYMERKGLTYQYCNDIMGALAGAQMEYYRRYLQKYEDLKIDQNGDV